MESVLSNEVSVNLDVDTIVKYYFDLSPKYTQKEICSIVNTHHQIPITVRRIRYICKKGNLKRRRVKGTDLKEMVLNELGTSRSLVGYRQMSEILCLKYDVHVPKENVRLALLEVDPEGVEQRRNNVIKRRVYESNGPNDICHIDGNDKLKTWGFCIHGGVDGFSRKFLWLNVSSTNKDPLVVSNFFLSFIKIHKYAPRILRMDKGTENIYCEDLQVFFTGDPESFRYAASTRNQRIEASWSRLKKFRLKWWQDFFRKLERDGIFRSEIDTHQELLMFSFMPVIQKELNEFARTWNTRYVRQSAAAPGGKPDVLFSVPDTVGFQNQGKLVSDEEIEIAERIIGIHHQPVTKDENLHELLLCYVHIHNLCMASDADEALDLYVDLLTFLQADGFSV